MAVSSGFFKKIQRWVIDNESGELLFLPFQTEGNPYKSKILLVGSNSEPLLEMNASDIQLLADTLVDTKKFLDVFQNEVAEASREFKGSLKFASWVNENFGEQVVLSSINCLNSKNTDIKRLKKENDPLYLKGFEIFKEVINEFQPNVLIIQGSATLKLFLEQFENQLLNYQLDDLTMSVQELEEKETITKLSLNSGKEVNILVSRSMGAFGKEGRTFRKFKENLKQLL
ncbi:MAG TPA: hypothetical protein VNS08_05830 [Ureibacillus sp.]|nr:hypothetical protein [Ureibacillus sp.]